MDYQENAKNREAGTICVDRQETHQESIRNSLDRLEGAAQAVEALYAAIMYQPIEAGGALKETEIGLAECLEKAPLSINEQVEKINLSVDGIRKALRL